MGNREIASQGDAFTQLDSKVGVLLGFLLVAIVQILGFLLRILPSGSTLYLKFPLWFLLVLAIGVFAILAAVVLGASERWPRNFHDGAGLDEVSGGLYGIDLLREVLKKVQESIANNNPTLNTKVELANWTTVAAVFGLVSFVVAGAILFVVPAP